MLLVIQKENFSENIAASCNRLFIDRMAVCDKWVALKIAEFVMCMACLAAKRVSQDDEARLALLLQKLSREWSLLNSVTWNSVGGAFADAIYGGYVIITFAFILGRVFQEIPKGRRILEGVLLGLGMIFFIVLGGLELASLDSVPSNLIVNASVLGTFSLVTAALFLIDLMGPRIYTATHYSQTDSIPHEKVIPPIQATPTNQIVANGQIPNGKSKDTTEDKTKTEKFAKKEQTVLFEEPKHGYTKFDDATIGGIDLEKSKFGSVRNDFETGNYIRLSDPLAETDRLHYERELAKFNENYFRSYLDDGLDNKISIKEDYFPEPQQPLFAKVKSGRLKSLHEDVSPNYETKRNGKSPTRQRIMNMPTLQQLEDYLRGSNRSRRADTPVAGVFPMEPIEERDRDAEEVDGRASGTPTDPGYVQYTADRWPEKRDAMTPRHSPK